MKKILLLLFIPMSISMLAQTQVNGNQSGVWSLANSPYEVTGEIIVPNGQTLSIEAGVEINFQAHYKFVVQGNLQAIGTMTDTIKFTTNNPNIGWGGIRFDHADGINQLSYCLIEFGKTNGNYPDNHGGGMALLTSDAVVSHCVFANNDATGNDDGMGGAIYAYNTGGSSGTLTRFEDCKFLNNHAYGEGGAIKFTSDMNSEIKNCEFVGNNCLYGGGAIAFYSVTNTKMIQCLFAGNYTEYSAGGAISTLGTGNSLSFRNCTFSKNAARHGDGGGINLAYANATFVNSIIYDNHGMYSDDINLDMDGHATINYSDANPPAGATGSNNIYTNPLFVDTNAENFHLSSNSPCIDSGTDIGLPFQGSAPDMGCYEYGTSAVGESDFYRVSIYPNPAREILHVSNVDGFNKITLNDISGKQLLYYKLSSITSDFSIDLKGMESGLYLLSFFKEKQVQTYKIIIDK